LFVVGSVNALLANVNPPIITRIPKGGPDAKYEPAFGMGFRSGAVSSNVKTPVIAEPLEIAPPNGSELKAAEDSVPVKANVTEPAVACDTDASSTPVITKTLDTGIPGRKIDMKCSSLSTTHRRIIDPGLEDRNCK
jgi:hypothetical protein